MAPRLVSQLKFDDISMIYKPVIPIPLFVDYVHLNSTYEGTTGNDFAIFNGATKDVAYGNGGYDYIATYDGNDKLFAGNNNGTWRGTGNEIGNSTTLDGGNGNDDFTVNGTKGAFHVVTGSGQDDVVIKGGDYVKIDNSGDGGDASDTYTFGANFNGDADIYSADANDVLKLQGGDWHYDGLVNGNMTYTNSTGGSVTLYGVTPNYNDPDVVFA